MRQDHAQIEGEVRVRGAHLAELIRQQPNTETTGWGEPVVHEGWVFVRLRRGPMLGAWRADLVRTARRLLGPDAEVVSHARTVIAKRIAFDRAEGASLDEYGPEARARRKLEGREREARYKAKYGKVT